jgi:hypothetical protein
VLRGGCEDSYSSTAINYGSTGLPNTMLFIVAPRAIRYGFSCGPKCHVESDKNRCSIFVIVVCRSYICLEERRWSMLKKEEGEKINMRHDENKKFLCKLQVVIVYNM